MGLLVTVLTIPFGATAHAEGLEPYTPATDQLRRAIQGVWESHTFRHPAALEQDVREALRSIAETEGRTDPQLARHLSAHLRSAWMELERSRIVGELGYIEFDEPTFRASDARFREIVAQYSGARTAYSKARNRAALKALIDIQTLSRKARRQVPGLSSDDVLLVREKRQILLLKEPKAEEGFGVRSGSQAMPSR